jgi:TRAP transporter TAXI family solute receptor
MNKRRWHSVVAIILCLMMAVGCGTAQTASQSQGSSGEESGGEAVPYGIATATVGGAFYAVGQSMANVINANYSGVNMAAEVTDGAVQNPRLVDTQDIAFAITNADAAYYAVEGIEYYEAPLNIAAIGNLHPSVLHLITLENSSINTVEDLRGKRIAIGPAGGAGVTFMTNLLAEYGMTLDDVKPTYISWSDGFTQLGDNNVDAAVCVSGYPASAVMEIGTTKDIKFIDLGEDAIQSLCGKFSFYTRVEVDESVYGEAFVTLGISNIFICNGDLDEDLVYNVTKALYGHLDELKAANASAAQIDEATMMNTAIPLHPGAAKYWEELG